MSSLPTIVLMIEEPNKASYSKRFEEASMLKIGRGQRKGIDVSLEDPTVARVHAALQIKGDENISLMDMGSSSGTLLDGKKLRTKKKVQHGSKITCGNTTITVYLDQVEESSDFVLLEEEIIEKTELHSFDYRDFSSEGKQAPTATPPPLSIATQSPHTTQPMSTSILSPSAFDLSPPSTQVATPEEEPEGGSGSFYSTEEVSQMQIVDEQSVIPSPDDKNLVPPPLPNIGPKDTAPLEPPPLPGQGRQASQETPSFTHDETNQGFETGGAPQLYEPEAETEQVYLHPQHTTPTTYFGIHTETPPKIPNRHTGPSIDMLLEVSGRLGRQQWVREEKIW